MSSLVPVLIVKDEHGNPPEVFSFPEGMSDVEESNELRRMLETWEFGDVFEVKYEQWTEYQLEMADLCGQLEGGEVTLEEFEVMKTQIKEREKENA